ncbi:Uncharacterized conserved protein [Pseudoxanthomonas sp. CF385]|uniref:GFA family protein n=1 Tax=Pseudoxanthomonas sp. CF385 TaxID=1881042 RepID=UPI000891BE2A|nr:hypothetical protein [Pseudoxanthomonas sp. CF385]SDR01254.1 Uncharacterized conserved protein [Pseudoxanthomonas sp. CF385]
MTTTHATLEGGCHCGAIALAFSTALVPANTAPRACDCSFCRAHGAAWVSDADARLSIHAHRPDRLHRYRQGSLAAQFLLCADCGVLVAVVFEEGDRTYAAVNACCLAARDAFAPVVPASPQTLAPEEKTARWRQLWISDVRWT